MLQRARELHVRDDALEILLADVVRAIAAAAVREIAALDARAQRLDRLTRERVAGEHDLESVVFGRIVRAGHRHARQRAEVIGREIQHRRRDHADVDHVDAARLYAARERRGERRDPRDGRRGRSRSPSRRARALRSRSPGRSTAVTSGVSAVLDDAADVVGLEDLGRDARAGLLQS